MNNQQPHASHSQSGAKPGQGQQQMAPDTAYGGSPGPYAGAYYGAWQPPKPGAYQGYQGGYMSAHPGQVPGSCSQGYAGYPQASYQSQQTPFLNFGSDRFLKGMLIGAAADYLLTNESVQRTAIKGVVKVWSVLQGGVEEMKERFHDAEAEIRAAEAGHQD